MRRNAPYYKKGIASHHHIILQHKLRAGGSIFSVRLPQRLYKRLRTENIETRLSSSITAVFFAAFVVAVTMWYGSTTIRIELFGQCTSTPPIEPISPPLPTTSTTTLCRLSYQQLFG